MPIFVASHHIVEDGVHVLAQQVFIVVFEVEGFLVGGASLDHLLLDFQLCLESLFVALATVLGYL